MYRNLLQLFATEELIKWSGLCSVFESELRSSATNVFPATTDQGNERWTQLRNRVVEHVSCGELSCSVQEAHDL